MSKRDLFKGALTSVALILVGILIVWAISTGSVGHLLSFAQPSSVQAAASEAPALSAEGPDDVHTCTSVGVAVYPERVHVECSVAAPGGIRFFALGTSNPSHAARILSVLSMAHVTGKALYIDYDPGDTSGEAIGCMATDCRLIRSAAILP